MSDKAILNRSFNPPQIVKVDDLGEWGKWMEDGDRRVKSTNLPDDVRISTVFLGLNHQLGDGPPLWFETMVFGGPLDQLEERYSSWGQAEVGHEQWVKKAKAAK